MNNSLKNLKKLDPAYFHTGMQSKRLLRETSMALKMGPADVATRAQSFAWHRAKGVYYGNRAADAVCLITGEGAMPWPVGRFFNKHRSKAVKAGPLAWGAAGLTVALVTPSVALVSAAIMGSYTYARGRGFARGASDAVGVGVYVGVHAAAVTSKLVALLTGSVGLGARFMLRAAGYAVGSLQAQLSSYPTATQSTAQLAQSEQMSVLLEPLLGAPAH